MTVIKNQKSNTYEVRTYYKDWTGVRKQKTKRGFKRKCDAQEWERAFKLKENLSRKKDSPIFFEKEVAGNKTFRYSAMAEHHDELSE